MCLDGKVVEVDKVLDVELEEFVHDFSGPVESKGTWHLSTQVCKYASSLK
jgi:hypothetical protein